MIATKINTNTSNPNLLDYFMTFNDAFIWSVSSGTGIGIHSTKETATGARSLSVINSDFQNTDITIQAVGKNTGFYLLESRKILFSVSAFNPTQTRVTQVQSIVINLFKDASPFTTLEFTVDEFDKWVNYGQYLNLDDGTYTVTITQKSDATSTLTSTEIFLDNFIFSEDKQDIGLPMSYVEPKEYDTTGWQSRIDTTNTQVLTGATDNLISFTGTLSGNGGLTLLDSNSKITPIQENDVVTVDFAFTAIVPAGSDHFLSILLKVNGVVYRAQNVDLIKGVGDDDYFSVSWTLPVQSDFKTYGGLIYINPDTDVTIKDRYINCTRTHKAI